MKKLILSGLAALVVLSAQAQLFSRESFGTAAVGGLIGGIIGHNSGRKTAEGVAIGAGAGLLLGALDHNARRSQMYYSPGYDSSYEPAFAYQPDYYSPGCDSWYEPSVSFQPNYGYQPARANYAIAGAALGGIAGGVIGHNSGRRTAEGVAIGAGAGLLLGGLAEYNTRRQEAVRVVQPVVQPVIVTAPVVSEAPAVAASATPTPILNNYPGTTGATTAMSGANSLFGR